MISRKRQALGKRLACVASVSNRVMARKLERKRKKKKRCSLPNFLDELARQRLPSRQEKDQGNAVTEIF